MPKSAPEGGKTCRSAPKTRQMAPHPHKLRTTLRKFPQSSTDFLQFALWNAVSLRKLSRVTAKTAENAVPLRKESRETALNGRKYRNY
jgi:hypothetical protein